MSHVETRVAKCALQIARCEMRVAALSLFFLKRKEKRKWERRRCDLPQREGGRKEERGEDWKGKGKRAH